MAPSHSKPISESPKKKKKKSRISPTQRLEDHCSPVSPFRVLTDNALFQSPDRISNELEDHYLTQEQLEFDHYCEQALDEEQQEFDPPEAEKQKREDDLKGIRDLEAYLEWEKDIIQKKRVRNDEAERQAIASYAADVDKEPPSPKVNAVCFSCAEGPCVMIQQQDEFLRFVDSIIGTGLTNKQSRHSCYRYMVRKLYGVLPKGVRKQLPDCVQEEVHATFPAVSEEQYTGFKPSQKEVV